MPRTRRRSNWRKSAGRSRCSTPIGILSRILPCGCRRRFAAASSGTGYAIRHLNSIAPTGTISLAFADNASNGIEPPYAWLAERRKRAVDGGWERYPVMDHAFRLWTEREENAGQAPEEVVGTLPAYFRSGAGNFGRRAQPRGHGGAAVHRFGDLQDRERTGGLPVRALPGPLHDGLGARREVTGDVQAQRHHGQHPVHGAGGVRAEGHAGTRTSGLSSRHRRRRL